RIGEAEMKNAPREGVRTPDIIQEQRIPLKVGGPAALMDQVERFRRGVRPLRYGVAVEVILDKVVEEGWVPDRFGRARCCRRSMGQAQPVRSPQVVTVEESEELAGRGRNAG